MNDPAFTGPNGCPYSAEDWLGDLVYCSRPAGHDDMHAILGDIGSSMLDWQISPEHRADEDPSGFVPDVNGRDARFSRTDDGELPELEPEPDEERCVDLRVRCTVDLDITLAEPYDAGDIFDLAHSELHWHGELVSVDDVLELGPATPALEDQQTDGRIRRLLERVLHV